jgi:hypothetical protein
MHYLEMMANGADLGKRAESGSSMKAAMFCRLGPLDFDEIGESHTDALAKPYNC